MWAFAHSSRLRRRTAVRSRPRWGRRACRWASLRRFLTVCAEILCWCKPIVAAAVRVAGLRRSWCWMWRSWTGVVTRGQRLWGQLDLLPNYLKRLWRRLMVEKWTFNSWATALDKTMVFRIQKCMIFEKKYYKHFYLENMQIKCVGKMCIIWQNWKLKHFYFVFVERLKCIKRACLCFKLSNASHSVICP